MSIEQWSKTAGDNNEPAKDGMQEGMDRDQVNDQYRLALAALATFHEDGEWADLTKQNDADFTVSRAGVKSFLVTDLAGVDASSKFPIGRWCKVTGTGTPTVAYGQVLTAVYADPILTVTLEFVVDASYADSDIPDTTVTKVECFFNSRIRQAAFHEVGTTPAQSPSQLISIDDMSSAAVITELNAATGLDADTVAGLDPVLFSLLATVQRNALINSSMSVWQREIAFTLPASGDYTADRWQVLVESAKWDVAREDTDLPAGFRHAIKLTSNDVPGHDQKVGIFSVLSGEDSAAIVGAGNASLSYWVKNPTTTGIAKVRAAILEFTGTEDTITNVVGGWSVEGTDPTMDSNWAYANAPSADEQLANDSWVEVKIENIPISSGTKNLAVFLWIEDKSYNNGDIVRFTGVQLVAGALALPYQSRKFHEELHLCLPFFEKTYDYDVHPGDISQLGRIEYLTNLTVAYVANELRLNWRYHTPKFKTPTITLYSPGTGATGTAWNVDDADDVLGASTANNVGTAGCTLQVTDNPDDNNTYVQHAVAVAEL